MSDPTSGRTYYANQQTGVTSWEVPAGAAPAVPVPAVPAATKTMAPQTMQPGQTGANLHHHHQQQQPASHSGYQQQQYQQPVQQQQQQQHHQLQQQQQQQHQQHTTTTTPSKPPHATVGSSLANKYGDGFVSSASNPELAAQYGNVGTTAPYDGAARPGAASIGSDSAGNNNNNGAQQQQQQQPAPAAPAAVPPEHQPILDGLGSAVGMLSGCQLNAVERKQLSEIQKGLDVLKGKLGRGEVEEGTVSLLLGMGDHVRNRDLQNAAAIQTQLANTVWKQHKDFLKGVKFLLQLAGKKLV